MKKDGQEGNQKPPGSQTENPGATDNLQANSNGNETNRTLGRNRCRSEWKTGCLFQKARSQSAECAELDGSQNSGRQEKSFEERHPTRLLLQISARAGPGWQGEPGRI